MHVPLNSAVQGIVDQGWLPWIPFVVLTSIDNSLLWIGATAGIVLAALSLVFFYQRNRFFNTQPELDMMKPPAKATHGLKMGPYRLDPMRTFPKIFDVATMLALAALIAVGLAAPNFANRWSNVLTWAPFALVPWVTIAVGMPFTTQYAQDTLPAFQCRTSLFKQMNLEMSLIFAFGLTLSTLSSAVCAIESYYSPCPTFGTMDIIFNWVLPFVFLMAAFKLSMGWYRKNRGKTLQQRFFARMSASLQRTEPSTSQSKYGSMDVTCTTSEGEGAGGYALL